MVDYKTYRNFNTGFSKNSSEERYCRFALRVNNGVRKYMDFKFELTKEYNKKRPQFEIYVNPRNDTVEIWCP